MSFGNKPEPAPTQGARDVWPEVWPDWFDAPDILRDMVDRHLLGISRYGVALQTHNGRNALVDAYQECLDLRVYLEQARMEGKQLTPLIRNIDAILSEIKNHLDKQS